MSEKQGHTRRKSVVFIYSVTRDYLLGEQR